LGFAKGEVLDVAGDFYAIDADGDDSAIGSVAVGYFYAAWGGEFGQLPLVVVLT